MGNVKTAISIQESLFKEINALVRRMRISRSQLFARAVRDFIQKQKNRQLFEQLNRAYDDVPDLQEGKRQERSKVKYRKIVEGQW